MTGKQFVEACKKDKCKTQSRSANGLGYHNKYTEELGKRGYKGINKKGVFTKRYPYGVVGHCCAGVEAHFIWADLEEFVPTNKGYIFNTNVYRKWLMSEPNIKGYGKVDWVTDPKKAKVGAVAFKGDGENYKSATHTCVFIKCEGNYVWTVDFNVSDGKGHNNGTIHKRHKKYFLGFANMPYPADTKKYQKAYHPMANHRVSCEWNEGLHRLCSSTKANHRDYPTDLVGKDSGRDWAFAPCDMIVLRKYTSASHAIWLRSKHKVYIPCKKDPVYLYMMCEHQDNSEMGAVGHVYKQGEKMFREGKNGNATGNHLHTSFSWSDKKHPVKKVNGERIAKTFGSGWIKNNLGAWVLQVPSGHNIKIKEAVFF